MNKRELIYQNFLRPFENKSRNNIGVELEFPLLNLDKKPVSPEVTEGLMNFLCENGFRPDEKDRNQLPVFVINNQGDVLSFDNSFNNFEFSLEKGTDLYTASLRFYEYFGLVQSYLNRYNHSLCGMGINPYKKFITKSQVDIEIYAMVREYLSSYNGGHFHKYPDFPAYLSSIQTHLDVPIEDLPRAFTLYAKLDFARAILFSNSLPFEEIEGFEDTICFRDYLWEKSGFGALADNVGKVNGSYNNIDDLIDYFLKKSMFYRLREGKYVNFEPQTINDYFDNEENFKDIDTYLSFKSIEITKRGTLEIRSDCAQPIYEAFVPAAFNLGILCSLYEAEGLVNDFFIKNNIIKNNATLRDSVIYNNQLPARKEAVTELLTELVSLADNALTKRNKNEELLIKPLFERSKSLICPALNTKHRLSNGENIDDIIRDYSCLHDYAKA